MLDGDKKIMDRIVLFASKGDEKQADGRNLPQDEEPAVPPEAPHAPEVEKDA